MQRRWIGTATLVALALLIVSTVAAVLIARDAVSDQQAAAASAAARRVQDEVRLNLERDVAAAAGLAASVDDATTIEPDTWDRDVEQVARAGAFTDVSAVALLVVASEDTVDAVVGSLPVSTQAALDLRLADRGPHAVIVASWPRDPNRTAIGFDVFSNPEAANAAGPAARQRVPKASGPLRIVQEPESQRATVVYVPIVPEPGGSVTGLVNLVFRAEALLDATLTNLPTGTQVRWVDTVTAFGTSGVQLAAVGGPVTGGVTASETFTSLGRTWRIEVTLPEDAFDPLERRTPWLVAGLGAVMCLGLAVTTSAWRTTARRADALAARRTAALAATTAQLETTNHELQDLDRFKDRMLGAVSHDLRSPLAVIRGNTELLLERELSPAQQRELLRRTLRQASRSRRLIDELLLAAQVRAGRVVADRRPLELAPLVAATVADLGTGELVTDGDGPLPPGLADDVHVERILHNLLTNATTHGEPPVQVRLARSADATSVELSVADHGPGVPEDMRSAIFDEFARAGARGPGYGLGLSIARQLATANGGELSYRDGGPGACFVLTLPVATDSAPAPAPAPATAPAPTPAPETTGGASDVEATWKP